MDKDERIKELEKGLREAVGIINWFEGWLNNRKIPVPYDDAYCACGHRGLEHNGVGRCSDPEYDENECDCQVYYPITFSVSYDARSCAQFRQRMLKLAGDP